MKKFITFSSLLVITMAGFAQNVDNFEVGPYEIDYKGPGDYKYRLRKDVNLYEFFGLKKDTTILVVEEPAAPVKHAIQINAFVSMPGFWVNGASNVWGIEGTWKQKIGQQVFFNAGLSFGLSIGKYGDTYNYYKDWEDGFYSETMFEIGVPISLEFCKLDRRLASMYGSVGVVPTFYSGAKNAIGESQSGLLVSPRIDFGGYLPIAGKLVRLGIFYQYNINCSSGDEDIFKERIAQNYVGANIGLLF